MGPNMLFGYQDEFSHGGISPSSSTQSTWALTSMSQGVTSGATPSLPSLRDRRSLSSLSAVRTSSQSRSLPTLDEVSIHNYNYSGSSDNARTTPTVSSSSIAISMLSLSCELF